MLLYKAFNHIVKRKKKKLPSLPLRKLMDQLFSPTEVWLYPPCKKGKKIIIRYDWNSLWFILHFNFSVWKLSAYMLNFCHQTTLKVHFHVILASALFWKDIIKGKNIKCFHFIPCNFHRELSPNRLNEVIREWNKSKRVFGF